MGAATLTGPSILAHNASLTNEAFNRLISFPAFITFIFFFFLHISIHLWTSPRLCLYANRGLIWFLFSSHTSTRFIHALHMCHLLSVHKLVCCLHWADIRKWPGNGLRGRREPQEKPREEPWAEPCQERGSTREKVNHFRAYFPKKYAIRTHFARIFIIITKSLLSLLRMVFCFH